MQMAPILLEMASYGLVLTPLAGALHAAITCASAPRPSSGARLSAVVIAAITWINAVVLLALTCVAALSANWEIATWMALGQGAVITAGFLVDPTAAIVAFVIASTNLAVHTYRFALEAEAPWPHHDTVVHFGVCSALLAVIANNYGLLLVGWEGVALATWLLVRFQGDTATTARTLVFQGIASTALLTAVVFMLLERGSLAYLDILGGTGSSAIIGIALVAAAISRGGLWPLHPWLERSALLGTPSAAFIQTVFAAPLGTYLLIRSWSLLSISGDFSTNTWALALPLIGLAGAVLMAACAIATPDPRRALAYSTSSQGAIAMTVTSMGLPAVALLQLAIHTCVKCVLLLTTGLVERTSSGAFDLTTLGGLRVHQRTTFWIFLMATVVLALPPFASFWIYLAMLNSTLALDFSLVGVVLAALTLILTSMYLFRLLFGMFMGANPSTVMREGATSISSGLSACLFGLVAIAFAVSHQASPVRLSPPVPGNFAAVGALPSLALAESKLALAGVLLTLAGGAWAWLALRGRKSRAAEPAGRPHHLRYLLGRGLMFDSLYTTVIARPVCRLSGWLWAIVDVAFVELLWLRGIGAGVGACGWLLGGLQNGRFAPAATVVLLSSAAMLLAIVWLTAS